MKKGLTLEQLTRCLHISCKDFSFIGLFMNQPWGKSGRSESDKARSAVLCHLISNRMGFPFFFDMEDIREEELRDVQNASWWRVIHSALDTGLHSELPPTSPVYPLWQSRQSCRAAIYAFLGVARRRRDLRVKVARDIWRMIAEYVWDERFDWI